MARLSELHRRDGVLSASNRSHGKCGYGENGYEKLHTDGRTNRSASPRWIHISIGILASMVLAIPLASHVAGQDSRAVPSRGYFLAISPHFDGDYLTSLRTFRSAARSGIRSSEGRWIDSICYHAMIGECHYQMGDLAEALKQFEAALNLFLVNRDWMRLVQFPPAIGPSGSSVRGTITWAASTRASVLGQFPDKMQIFQGRLDQEQVLRQGGVVAPPELYPVHVHEIVRCTALALRRRMDLLGPAAPYDPLSVRLVEALGTWPGPLNHWSRSWIAVQLGLAYASDGKFAEAAAELQSAILISGQYDHPLTSTALLELGKLALRQNQHPAAATYFIEATMAAAEFGQADIMEEAFHYGLVTHLATNNQNMYPPLALAADWARRNRHQQLYASLLLCAAENQAVLRQTAAAVKLLADARRALGRRDMVSGKLGARLQFQLAQVSFQQGNVDAGNAALSTVMAFQQKSSHRLFQIAMTDGLFTAGSLSPRNATMLYDEVLREPRAEDWIHEPLETLTVVTTPLPGPMEHWFQATLSRKALEPALEVADRIRRHRFYASLPMGGRLLALRWILEAPEPALSETARRQRRELSAKHPHYAALSGQGRTIRDSLAQLPLDASDPEQSKQQSELIGQLATISGRQETILREIAVRREPSEFVFPPQRSTKEIQANLGPGQLALIYFATSRRLHAFMLSRDQYAHWEIASPAKLQRQISSFLRRLGNFDANKEVATKILRDEGWKEMSAALLAQLVDKRQFGFWNRFQELIIVPDGMLWYVPFEILHVTEANEADALMSKLRIRYLPTASLIVPDARGHKPLARAAVALGQLFPRDDNNVSVEAFGKLQQALPGAVSLKIPPPGPTGVFRCVWDRLVVYQSVDDFGRGPYDWSPAQIDAGKAGSNLDRWLALPWGGPEQIALPGFQTAAANALKRSGNGNDVFFSLCGLMATGARTVLISRWRTGGQTSYDLVREFLQELPHSSAADAWHRSVRLARDSELDLEREPRVSASNSDDPLTAEHPFFWAGYLLIDTAGAPPARNQLAEPAGIAKDAAR